MVLFLAINTSSVTLLPTSVIALRAAAGSANPAGILPTTLFATFCSTVVAIVRPRRCSGGGRCRPAILHQGTRLHRLAHRPGAGSEELTEPLPASAQIAGVVRGLSAAIPPGFRDWQCYLCCC